MSYHSNLAIAERYAELTMTREDELNEMEFDDEPVTPYDRMMREQNFIDALCEQNLQGNKLK
jgi:hypothetical protein